MTLPTRRRPTAVLRNFPETRWDMDRLFDEFFVRPMVTMNPAGPQADFYETDEDFVLEMNLPGFTEARERLRQQDVVLFDRGSRPEFGAVAEAFESGQTIATEINDRETKVVGLFEMGTSFGIDGTIITSIFENTSVVVNTRPEAPSALQAAGGVEFPGVQVDVRRRDGRPARPQRPGPAVRHWRDHL